MAKTTRLRDVDEDDEDDDAPDDRDLEKGRMPFLSHLADLRDRVRNAAIFFSLAFCACWYFSGRIYDFLRQPMLNVWPKAAGDPTQVFTKLTEPFWVDMSIGLWAGIFVSSPFIFYQLWRFIAPGLYKRERRVTVLFVVFSGLFFTAGALFCYYFVLENLYSYFLGFASDKLKPMITISDYLDLSRDMMLAFGAVFEMPLFIAFLSMVGLVTHRGLWKFNRWFIVIAAIVAALISPSPDVVSQIMMLTPMVVLYNLSIVIAWRITKRREAKQAVLKKKEDAQEDAREAAYAAKKAKKKRQVIVEDEEPEDDGDEDGNE
jgi:sec-independent protein translocase protein TatC